VLDTKKISEILSRGNTAEVKKTKDGIIILEVKRKIQSKDYEDDSSSQEEH
jgi:hypothetical protein